LFLIQKIVLKRKEIMEEQGIFMSGGNGKLIFLFEKP